MTAQTQHKRKGNEYPLFFGTYSIFRIFCNCCRQFKRVVLVANPDTVFCRKCANPRHRNRYYVGNGEGCKK